jgi:hypothetical protein
MTPVVNSSDVPSRHPARLPDPPLLTGFPLNLHRVVLGKDIRATPEQGDSYRHFRSVGDPPADALAAWLREHPADRRTFDLALENGIRSVPSPAQPLVDFFAALERTPVWLDPEMLRVAQRATMRLPLWSVGPGVIIGIAMSYLSTAANQTLVRTGDLHKKAPRRILETTAWWMQCTEEGGLDRDSAGFKTTARVRLIHAQVRAHIGRDPEWDQERFGLPVNQALMATTLLPFVLINTLFPVAFGHHQSARERHAIIHMYRYIGFLMGVDPELLVADQDDVMRLFWVTAWSEVSPDDLGPLLTGAAFDAIPDLFALPGLGPLDGPVHAALSRYISTVMRVGLGHATADGLGLRGLHPAGLAHAGVFALNTGLDVVRRVTPGGTRIAAHVGGVMRRAALQRVTGRLHPDLSFRRDRPGDPVTAQGDGEPLAA